MVIKKKTIKNKIQETPEQIRERELQTFLKERTEYLPEPTYYYAIGDRVNIGALQNAYVSDIYLDGKVYEIDYTRIDGNYGRPIKHEHQKMLVTWLNIRPYCEVKKESLIKNKELQLSYSQRGMSDIITKAYFFGIDFEPDYQRDYVWELEDKIALIDSIFNNIDIGKFVFIHNGYEENKPSYQILDGKQRIRAILDYYENRFAYNDLYFNDLSYRDQCHLDDYPISTAEIRNVNREQILRYFVKLNKHGKIMSKAQIEKVEKMIEDIKEAVSDEK